MKKRNTPTGWRLRYKQPLPFPVSLAFIALLICLPLAVLVSSCTSGCGGPMPPVTNYYTYIYLADSTNRFEEILYTDFDTRHTVGDSYLRNTSFHWTLRISKPRTTMLIRTRNRGWDTLEYAMTKQDVEFDPRGECDNEDGISMLIVGPTIVSHTFDTAYIKDNSKGTPYSYNSNVDRILYIK